MQGGNVIFMPDHANSSRESEAIWKFAHQLEKQLKELAIKVNAPSTGAKIWAERAWLIPVSVTVLFTVLGAAFAVFWYVGGLIVDRHVTSGIQSTRQDISRIDGNVQRIQDQLTAIQLKQLSINPESPQSIKDAQNLLNTAQQKKIQIDNATIRDVSTTFAKAAKANPDAWEVVTELVNYRSSLNANLSSPLANLELHPETDYLYPTTDIIGTFAHYGAAPISRAAKFNPIGVNSNPGRTTGDLFLAVDNSTITLDNMEIKSVVFSNSTILYTGGAVILENVYFINCKFRINRDSSQSLIASLVEPAPTNYSQPKA